MNSARRGAWGAIAAGWGLVAYLTDLLPPRTRYGYVHRLTRAVLSRDLPSVARPPGTAATPTRLERPADAATESPRTICILAADSLDIGGIGTVIEMLARGLRAHGVEPVVLCKGDGPRVGRLREEGIAVWTVSDESAAVSAITAIAPDVIQSHSAPPFIERAAMRSGRPLIPVMHNTEIHYTPARWKDFRALMSSSAAAIAVSTTVREFHERRIGHTTPITVIGNGAPRAPRPTSPERAQSRALLSEAIGCDLGDDVVFVCLARYDAQKNFAGLVAAFGEAIERAPAPVRLVCAGDPSDWVEFLRADALRRSGASPGRIHLLGNSDARTMLIAADAFVLDSFFEGWPVAATEARAFGRPLLLSDVGGARELVALDPDRSILIPNATGAADLVSDARLRTARRRARRQPTAVPLRHAVAAITGTVQGERAGGGRPHPSADLSGIDEMLARHADLIHAVAEGAGSPA